MLVEARPIARDASQTLACEVSAIHGGPLAPEIRVGQRIGCYSADTERVLVVLMRHTAGGNTSLAVEGQLRIDEADLVSCAPGVSGKASLEDAVAAALSDDCYAAAADAGLASGGCEKGGCSSGAGVAGVWSLAVAIGAIGLRAAVRRRP